MKVPNKFWFYHISAKDIIYFAEGDEYEYVISGGDLEHPNSRSTDEVESFFQKGYWVLTVPNKFKVEGLITKTIFNLCKDANNLYVLKCDGIPSPIFHNESDVLHNLYGENPLWEVYTEEKVKEQIKEPTTPDNFKFRHCSGCEHNGLIFSAKRYNNSYWITWFDRDTVEERVT